MPEHVTDLLGAYIDGELHGSRLQSVENHLRECPACTAEYQSLRNLSEMVKSAPKPEFTSPERFAAQVALRLPHPSSRSTTHAALQLGWWAVPVLLLVGWIFINTTFAISNWISTVYDLRLLPTTSAWLIPGPQSGTEITSTLGQLNLLSDGNLDWAESNEAFLRAISSEYVWQLGIVVMYLFWIVISWARQWNQGNSRLPDTDNGPIG